jgi:hypothetical protein
MKETLNMSILFFADDKIVFQKSGKIYRRPF